MNNEIIKADNIPGLAHNISVMYKLLHPRGLERQELEKRAESHNFYKIILMKYQEAKEASE